jgi:hypothetical protein
MTSKLKTDVLETVSGSGTIALTNQLSGMTSASVPSGSVVQVVGFNSVATFATTSTTYATTHLTQSITPLYANSKILVQIFGSVYFSAVADHGRGQIRKDGNTITGMTDDDMLLFIATATARGSVQSSFVITTAGSTNAATYAYYIKSGGGGNCQIYRNSGILITEIKQ